MRVLQLIDSLEAGGAERMAVNYANSLGSRIEFSALAATRKEGVLKTQLDEKIPYLFLGRKRSVDLIAVLKLKQFVKANKIAIVHAHGTSFFMAVLLKIAYPKINIVWHDHNGGRSVQKNHNNTALKLASHFFNAVIVVNLELKAWAERNLAVTEATYLPNYAVTNEKEEKRTVLKGMDGKKIVCLSNLRHPKNHALLLEAFQDSGLKDQNWTLHLVGKDAHDDYSLRLKHFITENKLEESVFIYGSCPDVYNVLQQCTIGVLASVHEGFPVTLLEYGISGLAVVSTNVGYCAEIIQEEQTGLSFDPSDKKMLIQQLQRTAGDEELRNFLAKKLGESIRQKYSEEIVMNALILQYQKVLDAKQK